MQTLNFSKTGNIVTATAAGDKEFVASEFPRKFKFGYDQDGSIIQVWIETYINRVLWIMLDITDLSFEDVVCTDFNDCEEKIQNMFYGVSGGSGDASVIVLNSHIQKIGNVGILESVLDEHIIQGDVLVNDGESLHGFFIGSFLGGNYDGRLKLKIINNGITTTLINNGAFPGDPGGIEFNFKLSRIDENTIKTSCSIFGGVMFSWENKFNNISDLDLSLPITIQFTGQSVGDNSASNQIFGEFSKIFWSATA